MKATDFAGDQVAFWWFHDDRRKAFENDLTTGLTPIRSGRVISKRSGFVGKKPEEGAFSGRMPYESRGFDGRTPRKRAAPEELRQNSA